MSLAGRLLRAADRSMARLELASRRDSPALLGFMFHHLFADRSELESGRVDPYQPILTEDFRRFVAHFLHAGYRFVSPADISMGLDPRGHFALLTFDDGYASSLRALAVIRELGVPATFFIAVEPIVRGEAFWWDALYRAMKSRGKSEKEIERRREHLKSLPPDAIRKLLASELGPEGLRPLGDDDRPLTPDELRHLSDDPLVTIGNHTADHSLLSLCDVAEVESQIVRGQDGLARLTGASPEIIAYPDGSYDGRVVRIARSLGLRLGVTTRAHKNHLPLCGDAAMEIGRFLVCVESDLLSECMVLRSDVQLRNRLQRLRDTARTGRIS